jgi:hypothetical protein
MRGGTGHEEDDFDILGGVFWLRRNESETDSPGKYKAQICEIL